MKIRKTEIDFSRVVKGNLSICVDIAQGLGALPSATQ